MRGPKAPRLPTAPPSYTAGKFDDVEPDTRLEALDFDHDDAAGVDLSDVTFTECRLRHVSLHEADLKSATFAESSLSDINAPEEVTHPPFSDNSARRSDIGLFHRQDDVVFLRLVEALNENVVGRQAGRPALPIPNPFLPTMSLTRKNTGRWYRS